MNEIQFIVFNITETVIDSWMKDGATLLMFATCMWISQTSLLWTILAGIMFFLFAFAKIIDRSERILKFHNKKELLEWINTLE